MLDAADRRNKIRDKVPIFKEIKVVWRVTLPGSIQ